MLTQPIAYMNSNNGSVLLAFGTGPEIIAHNNAIERLQHFIDEYKRKYIFGYLSYDLKNEIENLSSGNFDGHLFPRVHFWVPAVVVEIVNGTIKYVQGERSNENDGFIKSFTDSDAKEHNSIGIELKPRTSKEEYIKNVIDLKKDIQNGDLYEVNYCQEFFAENIEIDDPLKLYYRLNEITEAPFSCFLSLGDHIAFSGSPERFIKKSGNKLISSPIKGTHKRGLSEEEDALFKKQLLNDPKERSENVMIVDLVRNDLSKIATKGSVQVDELFGIYSYKTVHQMVSTISCELKDDVIFSDILRATFPMGSMTGAPKISAMQHIERYENFQRGLYSGSIGYFKPDGDFDFNVVIRTLLFNRKTNYLSCPVGGAITINSLPEKEYEECQVKISSILRELHAEV